MLKNTIFNFANMCDFFPQDHLTMFMILWVCVTVCSHSKCQILCHGPFRWIQKY